MTLYYRPETLRKAITVLNQQDQDNTPLYYPPRSKNLMDWNGDGLVDLSLLKLDTIQIRKNEVRLGSMVTFEQLAQSQEIQNKWDGVLSYAAKISATMALRNVATLGGSLLNPTSQAEVLLVLLALDTEVILITSAGKEERISISDFLEKGLSALPKGMLIREFRIPFNYRSHLAFERVGRTPMDYSIVSVVVKGELTRKRAHNLRIAVFGANPLPTLYKESAKQLPDDKITISGIEQCISKVSSETKPVGDYKGSAEYRTAMAEVLTQRCLLKLHNKATKPEIEE